MKNVGKVLLAAAAILCCLVLYLRRTALQSSEIEPFSSPHNSELKSSAQGLHEPPTEKTEDSHLTTFPAVPSTFGKIEEIKKILRELFDAGESFNAPALRHTLYEQLSGDMYFISSAQKALQNPSWAKETFGNLHAKLRYFGIKVLSHMAEKGSFEPLEQSIRELVVTVETGKKMDDEFDETDLKELLHAWLSLQHPIDNEDYLRFLDQFSVCSKKWSSQTLKIFENAIFFDLSKSREIEEAQTRTKHLFVASGCYD